MQVEGSGQVRSSVPSTTSETTQSTLMDNLTNGAHQTISFIQNSITQQTRDNAQHALVGVFIIGLTLALPTALISVQHDRYALAGLAFVAPIFAGAAAGAAKFLLGSAADLTKATGSAAWKHMTKGPENK